VGEFELGILPPIRRDIFTSLISLKGKLDLAIAARAGDVVAIPKLTTLSSFVNGFLQ
jgi:hypothetical protein